MSVDVRAAPDDLLLEAVRKQMDPFRPGSAPGGSRALIVERVSPHPARRFLEVQGPAGDPLLTAWDGQAVSVMRAGRWCTVPDPLRDSPARFRVDPGFPVADGFRNFVRPALQRSLLRAGAVTVHAASVEVEGGAVLVAGWSESGKTETALAMCETGAGFLSDKWTVWGPAGTASAFPVNVGLRRWVVPYLPRLRASLAPAVRARMVAAGGLGAATGAIRRRPWQSSAAQMASSTLDAVAGLADRVALRTSWVRQVYTDQNTHEPVLPVRAVVLLSTVLGDRIRVTAADPHWAATRLAASAEYERRPFSAVMQRRDYASASCGHASESSLAMDRDLLSTRLVGLPLLHVQAPFPTDPRRVAAAVSDALRGTR